MIARKLCLCGNLEPKWPAKDRKFSVATCAEELKDTVSVLWSRTGDAEEKVIYVMQIGDTTRAQHWRRETVDMGDPGSPDNLGYPNIEFVGVQ